MSLACRHCFHAAEASHPRHLTYQVVIQYGSEERIMNHILSIEQKRVVAPGLVVKCETCDSFSVVSFSSFVYMSRKYQCDVPPHLNDILSYYTWICNEWSMEKSLAMGPQI